MFLPKPLYEALPCIYVITGIVCLYVVSGMTLVPSLMTFESVLLFACGVVLGAAGIAVICLRYAHRKNGTVFVKYASQEPYDHGDHQNEIPSGDTSTAHE